MAISDRANISVPSGRHFETHKHVVDFASSLGGHFELDNLMRLDRGTLLITERSRFTSFSISGAFLQHLRDHKMLSQFLFPFAEGPHKLSQLHIAGDFSVDAPPVLRRLKRRAKAGEVKLTRKSVKPSSVRFIESHNYSDPSVPTGMLYLGSPKAEVRAGCYDKRNERLEKGFPDQGPTLRCELRISDKMGISLRDVVEPDSCYWNFMSDVMPPPPGIPDWVANDHNYRLEPPMDLEPYQLLRKGVETSPDVERLLELSERLGPNGFQTFVRLLENRRELHAIQPSVPVKAA